MQSPTDPIREAESRRLRPGDSLLLSARSLYRPERRRLVVAVHKVRAGKQSVDEVARLIIDELLRPAVKEWVLWMPPPRRGTTVASREASAKERPGIWATTSGRRPGGRCDVVDRKAFAETRLETGKSIRWKYLQMSSLAPTSNASTSQVNRPSCPISHKDIVLFPVDAQWGCC